MMSLSEAARKLNCSRATVSDLVRLMDIETIPHPSKGNAKAISDADLARLRTVLDALAESRAAHRRYAEKARRRPKSGPR